MLSRFKRSTRRLFALLAALPATVLVLGTLYPDFFTKAGESRLTH